MNKIKFIFSLLVLGIFISSCTKVLDKNDLESMDSRNTGIDISIKYKSIFNKSDLVLNVESVESDKAPIDIIRCVFQMAERLKDKSYSKIELAYKGKSKFFITGEYFKLIGDNFNDDNAVYLIRTFPENVKNMDETAAYDTWDGGALAVLGQQMSDFNDFMSKWLSE